MRLPFSRSALLIAAAALCLLATADARVFRRWRAAAHSTGALQSIGGRISYDAAVRINGGKGRLTILSFPRGFRETAREVGRVFGEAGLERSANNMVIADITRDGRVIKLLVCRVPESRNTLVFKLDQSERDARDSRTAPDATRMGAIPLFPGSTPDFYMEDDNTRASLAVCSTTASAEAVQSFFNSRLRSEGWAPLSAAGSPMTVYANGPKLCIALVDHDVNSSQTRITVLLKRRGIK